ncbi:MAG: phosphatidylglycerol lysyltransferase domain-containing protein [Bacteroidota bacterium]|nr:phosphatidylglycerol lysyltransferase domain-containing protein [Bacteroidota bacterium]
MHLLTITIVNFVKKQIYQFFYENGKIFVQYIVAILFIGLSVWFIKHEKAEVSKIEDVIWNAKNLLVLVGLGMTGIYIFFQGSMYSSAFASINTNLSLRDATILFLKRNLISVFLPAGGIASLVFFGKELENKGIKMTQIYFASSIYAFVGGVSGFIIAVPAFTILFSDGDIGIKKWYALGYLLIFLLTLYYIYKSILKRGSIYRLMIKLFPSLEVFISDLQAHKINFKNFIITICYSLIIDVTGIIMVYISMRALGHIPTLSITLMAYITMVLFMIISPFLKGLGAIEVSMSYVLIQSGYSKTDAVSITMLFRFFEFWLPLLAGVISFLLKANRLLMRILPAILIFMLGIINIISVAEPGIPERIEFIRRFFIPDFIKTSNNLVLLSGLFLLITAAFMLKGLRISWWSAILLCIISIIGHLTKGIDYEEASVSLLVLMMLIATQREYYIKSNHRIRKVGLQVSLISMATVLIYGIIGFYILDKKHFHNEFSFSQSVIYTFQNYFLIGNRELVPYDHFAVKFIDSVKIMGFTSITFLIFTFIRPFVYKREPSKVESAKAKLLVEKYGNSSLDYFKTYSDKLIFAPDWINGFISYRVSGNFAVVLENPVTGNIDEMKDCIYAFSKYCEENSLRDIYYRVPKSSLPVYNSFKKKSLFIGQEGIVDLATFSLEGGDKKPIRNALNKMTEHKYKTHIYNPPLSDGTIQKLKAVSNEWMLDNDRTELIFSQGMFVDNEIKQQTIITVENHEEKIFAFLNIIPDYFRNEGTFDIIRKTSDAPNGTMDFIMIELFKYFKSQNLHYVNLGFAPMSGLNDPHNFPEKTMKFAYEKIRSFSNFKGLREYKEKFQPKWHDKFLIYNHDFDLLQIPAVLNNVMKL